MIIVLLGPLQYPKGIGTARLVRGTALPGFEWDGHGDGTYPGFYFFDAISHKVSGTVTVTAG
jgi:hypothetical protein